MNPLSKKKLFCQKSVVRCQRSGFSLIELIVYFSIFALAVALGGTVFTFALYGKRAVRELSAVHSSTQRAVEQMVDRVHIAQTVLDASTTLNLKMASSSLDPTIFSLLGGVVRIKEGSASAVDVTPATVYVNSLSFVKVTNPSPSTSSVQIIITAGYNDDGAAKPGTEYTLQTTAMPLR